VGVMKKIKKKHLLKLIKHIDRSFILKHYYNFNNYLDDERDTTYLKKRWMDRGRAAAIMDIVNFFKKYDLDISEFIENEKLNLHLVLEQNLAERKFRDIATKNQGTDE
jgi:hypothetical protein